MRTRASATKPAKARQIESSSCTIFLTVLGSCSFMADFFSIPSTIESFPRTPIAVVPLFTASRAYSTWKRCPSGEKTVIARSYLAISSVWQTNGHFRTFRQQECLTVSRKNYHTVLWWYIHWFFWAASTTTIELLRQRAWEWLVFCLVVCLEAA